MSRPVLLDTWGWVEVLRGTPAGAEIAARYLDVPAQQVWTADISLVELAAALHRQAVAPEEMRKAVDAVVTRSSRILYPDTQDAVAAPFARAALRVRRQDASLADGLILAMARNRGADVITCDKAFLGEPDVVCPRSTAGP